MKGTKPLFQHWNTCTDRFFGTGPESPRAKVAEAHRRCIAAASMASQSGESLLLTISSLGIEREWHESGRPYYKVHSEAARWLMETSMNFSAEHFSVPFEVFSIMLPREFGPAGTFLVAVTRDLPDPAEQQEFFEKHRNQQDPWGKGLCASAADYCRTERVQLEKIQEQYGPAKLQLCFAWVDDDGELAYAHLVVYERMTLEDALRFLDEKTEPSNICAPGLHWKYRCPMIRVAIGVAMFAVNKHELVSADVNVDQLRSRYLWGRRRIAPRTAALKKIEEEIANSRGWTIGQEINLPRPEYERSESESQGEGARLEFSHVRSGHMKMQPHGPANSLRKLIFVAPTVVRKDLPMQPHRGFQIPDRVVPAGANT